MRDEREAVPVERELAGERATVLDPDGPPFFRAGGPAPDVSWPEGLVHRLLAGVDRVGELGGDGWGHACAPVHEPRILRAAIGLPGFGAAVPEVRPAADRADAFNPIAGAFAAPSIGGFGCARGWHAFGTSPAPSFSSSCSASPGLPCPLRRPAPRPQGTLRPARS